MLCVEPREKKRNYFITDEEVRVLWNHTAKYSTKWRIMLGFCLFRGMRIGEVLAINIYDFHNDNFDRVDVILEKSHIKDTFPLIPEFGKMVREYILKNRHTMKDGYLFPFYTSNAKGHHISTECAGAWICKLRKQIGKTNPQFLDRVEFEDGNVRYRIGWHSCRRWFETKLWDNGFKPEEIAFIMRYRDVNTVYTYLDSYKVWKNELAHIESTFGSFFQDCMKISHGQTRITEF